MQELADTELLRQYAHENSEAAFAELVTRHVPLVYSAALRKTGNPSAAEEVTQAVFIILARKARGLGRETALAGWLYQAARLTAANFLRTEIRRARREQEALMQSLANETGPETWRQIMPLLEDAMGRLGERERNAVVLRFFEGKSFQEVGAAVGASENAAKKRVGHALEKMRRFFLKHGVNSTAAAIGETISASSVHAVPVGLAKAVSAAALTKGAAASTSTLTLIKGASKIMAWSKAKTAVVAGVATILVIGVGTVAVSTISAARTSAALAMMQGSWEGIWHIQGLQQHLVFNIIQTNGVYRAALNIIEQGQHIPLPEVSAHSHSIHFGAPAAAIDYQATLNSDGTVMTGTFKRAKLPPSRVLLNRTDAPDTIGTLSPEQYAPRSDSPLQGEWDGTINQGKTSLRLDLRIAETAPGTFKALIDLPDQGIRNMPVTPLTFLPPTVRFELPGHDTSFQGNLNDSENAIAGTLTQVRGKSPLTFHRVETNSQAQKDYGHGAGYQIQGHWKGTLNAGQRQLRVMFDIALMPDGSYSATLDSPDQGATGIPATAVDVTYPNVRLEWKSIGGVFIGKLADGKLSGTWRQGKTVLRLELEKSAVK